MVLQLVLFAFIYKISLQDLIIWLINLTPIQTSKTTHTPTLSQKSVYFSRNTWNFITQL